MKIIVLLGRIFFSLIFLMTIVTHFSKGVIGFAGSKGVPGASFIVPLSGVIATLGAISIILGFKARVGAWLIVLFLIPVTLMMHDFWTVTDPQMRQMQMAMFMKNVSMLGGALMITYFGSGPLSVDRKV